MGLFIEGAGAIEEDELWCRAWLEGAREEFGSYGREDGK